MWLTFFYTGVIVQLEHVSVDGAVAGNKIDTSIYR